MRMGLPVRSIEKDFWVCWTLKRLFELPELGSWFTFKGGTSLSKVYGLIERFSEDIDLVIDREAMGFVHGTSLDPRTTENPKRADKRLRSLRHAAQKLIADRILPSLSQLIQTRLPSEVAWSLEIDPYDRDSQTLLFKYPSCLPTIASNYVSESVKLEFGARSDTEPAGLHQISPYCAQRFPALFTSAQVAVRAIAAERTFWDKATLLHEEQFAPAEKAYKNRMARHYYDLAALINGGVAERAMADLALFESVVEHRRVFFPYYDLAAHPTMRKGTLSLIPNDVMLPKWEADYRAMTADMIYGNPPTFAEIMQLVSDFQTRFNS